MAVLLALILLALGPAAAWAQEQDLPQLPVLSSQPLGAKGDVASLAVGDVNGHLDIVANGGRGEQPGPNRLYLNDGRGRFGSPEWTRTFGPPTRARLLALADLNGDGALDVVAGAYDEPDEVYLNDGAGGFAAPILLGEGPARTVRVAIGDLDGDGYFDVVTAARCPATESDICANRIYRSDGTGQLAAASTFGQAGQDGAGGLALTYVDGDNSLDIVLARRNAANQVFLNDGQGGFGQAGDALAFGAPGLTLDLAAGDLNADGRLDLVAVGDGSSAVYTLGADRRFTLAQDLASDQYTRLVDAELADLDGDSYLDLVAGAGAGDEPEEGLVFLDDGTGSFRPPQAFGSPSLTSSIAVADLNDDGALDVAVGNYDNAQSWIYLREALGLLSPAQEFGQPGTTAGAVLGDVTGNGYQDVVVLGSGGRPGVIYLNDGRCLAAGACPTYGFGDGQRQLSAALADLDDDGYLDLVVGNQRPNQIYLNRGSPEFSGFSDPSPLASTAPPIASPSAT